MIQKTAEAPSVHPFRPPKSPSSHVVATKSLRATPRSPRRTKNSKVLPSDSKQQSTTSDPSSTSANSLSPTSVAVMDPRGFLAPEQPALRKRPLKTKSSRQSRQRQGRRSNSNNETSNESDGSIVRAGNQCMKEGNAVGANFAFSLLLDERRKKFGPKHRLVGAALNDLAMVHLFFGDYRQAEKEFAQAAAIQIRCKRAHPLDVVKCLVNLGKARLMQEKRDGALSVFRDAVKIVRTKLGYDDVHVAEVQSQIGCLLFDAGDLASALRAFADALAVHRANENKVALAETLCDIGSIHLAQKSLDPAIECFLEALQLQRETFGDFHRDVIVTLDNLAFVHTKKREYDKALKYYNETLQAQVALFGEFTNECKETKRKEQLVFKKYASSRRARNRAMTA